MKKLLLTFSILFSLNSFSQPYLPMLEEGNVWSVDFQAMDGSIFLDQIEIVGETEINGVVYKELLFGLYGYNCLLREENGIVYHLNSPNDTEEIFYNFNLEVGDIFTYSFDVCAYSMPGNGGVEYEVTSVDTQFIAGENRKVIELMAYNTEYWIEGIGSLSGVDPHSIYVDMGETKLVCFTKDGVTTFFNGATSCDNTIIGTENFDHKEIILYPNPIINISILKFPNTASVDKIKIYNLNGKLVKENIVRKDYHSLNGMDYRSGIYFYQLFSNGKIIKTEKFIVK